MAAEEITSKGSDLEGKLCRENLWGTKVSYLLLEPVSGESKQYVYVPEVAPKYTYWDLPGILSCGLFAANTEKELELISEVTALYASRLVDLRRNFKAREPEKIIFKRAKETVNLDDVKYTGGGAYNVVGRLKVPIYIQFIPPADILEYHLRPVG